MRNLAQILVLLAIVATLMSQSAGAGSAQTDSIGVIFGHILNGTTNEPVSEIAVSLSTFAGGTLQPNQSTTTDEDGRFEFDGVSTDTEAVYAVSTSFGNVPYSTGRVSFDADSAGIEITLNVYEPTSDQSLVHVYSRGLILTDVEPLRGEIGALDIYLLGLSEDRTLIPDDEGRTLAFAVPRNATRVTPLSDDSFNLDTATIEGATVYGTDALLPGDTTATLSYTLPYTGDRLAVELQASYDTDRFRLLIPVTFTDLDNTVGLEAPGFEYVGQEEIGPQTYDVWARENVSAGDRMDIAYTDLVRSHIEPNTLNKFIPAIVATIAIMLAAGVAIWIVRSRSLQRERPVILIPQLATSLEDDRERLIDQLRALETAHENGIVNEHEYPHHRTNLLEQIRIVNRQLRGEGVED